MEKEKNSKNRVEFFLIERTIVVSIICKQANALKIQELD
jgi:hypothetical protein